MMMMMMMRIKKIKMTIDNNGHNLHPWRFEVPGKIESINVVIDLKDRSTAGVRNERKLWGEIGALKWLKKIQGKDLHPRNLTWFTWK